MVSERTHVLVVSAVDLIVAILVAVIGVLVVIVGFEFNSAVSSSYYMPSFMTNVGWALVLLGITTLVYGVKRLLDDILKMAVHPE